MTRESGRDAVLGAVRHHLAAARSSEPEPPALPDFRGAAGRPPLPEDDAGKLTRFKETLEAVGGHVTIAASAEVAANALKELLTSRGVRRCARTGDPDVERITSTLPGIEWLDPSDTSGLLDSDAGVTGAQWGVAETGSLVLCSNDERHRLASLLPPVHVALLRATRIVGALDEALARVAPETPTDLSRAVTIVTGPSRTADIELTLVVGVHGPKEMHVIVLEEDHA